MMRRGRTFRRMGAALTLSVALLAVSAPAFAASISGYVIDETGTRLSGMSVRAYPFDGTSIDPAAIQTTTTAGDGTYTLDGLGDTQRYAFVYVDPTGQHRDGSWDPFYFRGTHVLDSPYAPQVDALASVSVNHVMPTAAWLKANRTYRVSGPDRYSNAIAVSKTNFPAGATDIVLVSGASFADALSAAPLAGYYGAPILLTQPTKASSALIGEIKRLGALSGESNPKIWIVGGTASVSNNVVNQLKAAGLTRFQRFSGADRYVVSATVAKYVQSRTLAKEPFVVRGDVFADALSVSPFAYMEVRPILLTPPRGLTSSVKSAWTSMHTVAGDTIIAVGGPASITSTVLNQFDSISGGKLSLPFGGSIYGKDRYETGATVTDFYKDYQFDLAGGWDMLFMASGQVFPDALAGGAAAGYWYAPLVLTQGSSLSGPAKTVLSRSGPYVIDLQALGGSKTLASKTISAANSSLGTSWYRVDAGIVTIPASAGGDAGVLGVAAPGRVGAFSVTEGTPGLSSTAPAAAANAAAPGRPPAPHMKSLAESGVLAPLAR